MNQILILRKTVLPSILILLSAALSGCASGPRYSDMKSSGALTMPKEKALVLIYDGGLPWGKTYKVYANDNLVTDAICNESFATYYATPGTLRLASTAMSGNAGVDILKNASESGPLFGMIYAAVGQKKDLLVLKVAAGETYFVRMSSGMVREKLEWISNEHGAKEIAGRHWVNPRAEANP